MALDFWKHMSLFDLKLNWAAFDLNFIGTLDFWNCKNVFDWFEANTNGALYKACVMTENAQKVEISVKNGNTNIDTSTVIVLINAFL